MRAAKTATGAPVLNVSDQALTVDPAFHVVDFNTALATGPARPHGIGMR